MAETNVQIEVPRTGQKIRNVSASVLQSDGTVATVLMQVVTMADQDGNLVGRDPASAWDPFDDAAWDTQSGPMGFDTANNFLTKSVWES